MVLLLEGLASGEHRVPRPSPDRESTTFPGGQDRMHNTSQHCTIPTPARCFLRLQASAAMG